MKRFRRIFILNSLPPETSKNGINFFNERLRQKNILHKIDRNGSQNRIDVSDMTCMVKLVGFEASQFVSKLLQKETVSSGPVLIRESKRMTQVRCVRR